MSFDWADFLKLAESLRSDPNSPGPPEAALRSAASRAYYAAFHCALNLACREGYVPTYSGDDHRNVQKYYSKYQPPSRERMKIGLELNRLLDKRRKADYEDSLTSQASSLAANAIGMAQRIIEKLAALSSSDDDNS